MLARSRLDSRDTQQHGRHISSQVRECARKWPNIMSFFFLFSSQDWVGVLGDHSSRSNTDKNRHCINKRTYKWRAQKNSSAPYQAWYFSPSHLSSFLHSSPNSPSLPAVSELHRSAGAAQSLAKSQVCPELTEGWSSRGETPSQHKIHICRTCGEMVWF